MTPRPWKITWGLRSWTDDDLTAADLVQLQALTNDGWQSANPLASPAHLVAAVAVLESRTSGRPLEEVLVEVRDSPAGELADAIDLRELVPAVGEHVQE